jgi:hypothetical protein
MISKITPALARRIINNVVSINSMIYSMRKDIWPGPPHGDFAPWKLDLARAVINVSGKGDGGIAP